MADYQEYPKYVGADERGKPVIVNGVEEESLFHADKPILRDADERKRLAAVAEIKGVQIDKRWSLERIAKTITDAGFDATLDPFA